MWNIYQLSGTFGSGLTGHTRAISPCRFFRKPIVEPPGIEPGRPGYNPRLEPSGPRRYLPERTGSPRIPSQTREKSALPFWPHGQPGADFKSLGELPGNAFHDPSPFFLGDPPKGRHRRARFPGFPESNQLAEYLAPEDLRQLSDRSFISPWHCLHLPLWNQSAVTMGARIPSVRPGRNGPE